MSVQTAASRERLHSLKQAATAFDGKLEVLHTWFSRYPLLRDLPPEYVQRPGKGSFEPVKVHLEVVVQVAVAWELTQCGVRVGDALLAGLKFSSMGQAFQWPPGVAPKDLKVPDEKNRQPSRLFAGRCGTWGVYAGPRDFLIVADPPHAPLQMNQAFGDSWRTQEGAPRPVRLVVDLHELCERIARALELDFAIFKSPPRA